MEPRSRQCRLWLAPLDPTLLSPRRTAASKAESIHAKEPLRAFMRQLRIVAHRVPGFLRSSTCCGGVGRGEHYHSGWIGTERTKPSLSQAHSVLDLMTRYMASLPASVPRLVLDLVCLPDAAAAAASAEAATTGASTVEAPTAGGRRQKQPRQLAFPSPGTTH